jgi:hypothetical protein
MRSCLQHLNTSPYLIAIEVLKYQASSQLREKKAEV